MPPVTPSTIRRPTSGRHGSSAASGSDRRPAVAEGRHRHRRSWSGGAEQARRRRPRPARRQRLGNELAGRPTDALDLVGVDLLEGDRQWLAGERGDLRRDRGAEAVAEVAEVGVDLAGPHAGQGDERNLEDVRLNNPSMWGFIIVSWRSAKVAPGSLAPRVGTTCLTCGGEEHRHAGGPSIIAGADRRGGCDTARGGPTESPAGRAGPSGQAISRWRGRPPAAPCAVARRGRGPGGSR